MSCLTGLTQASSPLEERKAPCLTLCMGKTFQQPKEAMGQAAIQSPSAAFEMGVTLNGHVFPFDYSLPLKTRGAKYSLQAKRVFVVVVLFFFCFFFGYYLMAVHSCWSHTLNH